MTQRLRPPQPEDLLACTSWIKPLARRLLSNDDEADDIVQETCLAFLCRPPRGLETLKAWLNRVVRNLVLRSRQAQENRGKRERRVARPETISVTPDQALEQAEMHRLLTEEVLRMDEPYRSTVLLRFFGEQSLAEIARQQGVPLDTVKTRLRRAMDQLRLRLDRLYGGRQAWTLGLLPLVGGMAALSTPPAAASTTTAPAAGLGSTGMTSSAAAITNFSLGGFLVAQKKVALSIVIALFLLGGATVVVGTLHFRRGRELAIAKAPVPTPAAAVDSSLPSPAERPKEAEKSEEALPVDPFGSIVVHAVYEDDKAPTPGVLVRAFRKGDGALLTLTTDEKGEARFPRVPEGTLQVYLQRGNATYGSKAVEVEPGVESEVTLELPPGVGIDGIVVDGNGRPVPGASIWLTEVGNAFQGAAVAAAGDDGKFLMKHVELRRFIGARAAGLAPSILLSVEGRPASVLSIRIVLDRPSVAVEGVVVGPDGKPVADAIVKIEKEAGGLMWTPDGIQIRHAPLAARTDGEGAFAFDCVPVGELTIAARFEGLVPFQEPIAVPVDGLSGVRIQLEEGVTVSGTVRTPEGDPSPWAVVGIGTAETNTAHLSGYLDSLATSAGQDGTYRLPGVKPGEFEVRAHGHGKGKAAARFTARAGEEVRWDAQLSLGIDILGRVVDERGQPVEKVLVGADGEGCIHGWIWTGPDGRFRFSNCKQVPHTVSARIDDSVASAVEDDVMPGTGEVILALLPAARPSAFITGQLTDPEGKPAEAARLAVRGLPMIYPEKDGSFRIGPLPAGQYRVDVLLGGLPHLTRTRELGVGETVDLGTIQLLRGGRIEAHVRRPDGTPVRCSIRVIDGEGSPGLVMTYSSDGIATTEMGAVGDYGVLLWQDGIASALVPVRIEDGTTASVDLVVREGAARTFRLSTNESKSGRATRVTVRAPDGSTVFDWPVQPDSSGWKPSPDGVGRTLDLRACFAPGLNYSVEASVRDLRAKAAFAVSDLADTADPVVLDLR